MATESQVNRLLGMIWRLRDDMRDLNLDPEKMTIVVSMQDGIRIEHILAEKQMLVINDAVDERASNSKADGTIREFRINGIRIQYRNKLFKLPSGKIR